MESKMGTGGLGLAGEAGEVADIVKKIIFHEMELTEEVRAKLLKECGDVMWYLAFTARALGSSLQEVIDMNHEKLSARYKSGKFSHEEFMQKETAKG
jgi:NTP pyrophosphatase (non-canonical NTP hydrolase)